MNIKCFTCIRRQVEVKDGNDGDEDTGQDDVKHVIHGLPLDDQVEGDVLVQVLSNILLRNLMPNVPFPTLWDDRRYDDEKNKMRLCL